MDIHMISISVSSFFGIPYFETQPVDPSGLFRKKGKSLSTNRVWDESDMALLSSGLTHVLPHKLRNSVPRTILDAPLLLLED